MLTETATNFEAMTAEPLPFHDTRRQARTAPRGREAAVGDVGSVASYGPKETVYFEGDPAGRVFEITEGIVKLFKLTADGRCQVTGFLYPGQFFGFERDDEHSQTAEALTPVTLRAFKLAKLEQLADRNSAVQQHLLDAVRSQLLATQDHLLLLGRKTAQEKLASFLMRVSEALEMCGECPDRLEIPMSRTEIADYLGLTTETVSRCFGRLKDKGLLSFADARQITIEDRDRLHDLSEEDDSAFAH